MRLEGVTVVECARRGEPGGGGNPNPNLTLTLTLTLTPTLSAKPCLTHACASACAARRAAARLAASVANTALCREGWGMLTP